MIQESMCQGVSLIVFTVNLNGLLNFQQIKGAQRLNALYIMAI